MHCPVCQEVTVVMADRQGIEVDYCPRCRGVWLDRGELDKILERGVAEFGARASEGGPGAVPGEWRYERPFERHDSDEYPAYGQHGHPGQGKHRKRRSFLDDLFD